MIDTWPYWWEQFTRLVAGEGTNSHPDDVTDQLAKRMSWMDWFKGQDYEEMQDEIHRLTHVPKEHPQDPLPTFVEWLLYKPKQPKAPPPPSVQKYGEQGSGWDKSSMKEETADVRAAVRNIKRAQRSLACQEMRSYEMRRGDRMEKARRITGDDLINAAYNKRQGSAGARDRFRSH